MVALWSVVDGLIHMERPSEPVSLGMVRWAIGSQQALWGCKGDVQMGKTNTVNADAMVVVKNDCGGDMFGEPVSATEFCEGVLSGKYILAGGDTIRVVDCE